MKTAVQKAGWLDQPAFFAVRKKVCPEGLTTGVDMNIINT